MTPKEKKLYEEFLLTCKRIKEGTVVVPDKSEKDKQKRIKWLLEPTVEGFTRFCKYYFPDYCKAEFGWFHKEAIIDIIIEKNRSNIWEWPRECAKSVFGDLFCVTWLLVTGWLDGLILASGTPDDKGKKLIKDIEAQLKSNQKLINDFGDFGVIGSFLSGYFYTKDGIGFWSFSIGQDPAGTREGHRRPNLGIIDDADNKTVAKNQKLTKERVDWCLGEFRGCLNTKKQIFIYSNNRVHQKGLTAHMVGDLDESTPKRKGYKHIKVYWTEDPKTREMLSIEAGGVSCWPENYSIEDAQNKRDEMGYRNAMRQLYHTHIEDGDIFTEKHIVWDRPLPLEKYDSLVSYCDPSYSDSSKKADYKAIVLLGLKGKYIHILWAWVRQASRSAMVKAHIDLMERLEEGTFSITNRTGVFREVVCRHYMEGNFIQKQTFDPLYLEESEDRLRVYRPRYDQRKKPDKFGRIENLEPMFAGGFIRWNELQKKNPDFVTLKDQFLGFPNGNDDGPDAVEGGMFYLHRTRKVNTGKASKVRTGKVNRNESRKAI